MNNNILNMTDVIFYKNKLGVENVIDGYKYIANLPLVSETVIIKENRYIVERRLFDYDKNVVHIVVKK